MKIALSKVIFGYRKGSISVCAFVLCLMRPLHTHTREKGVERERREIRKLKGTTLGYSHANTPNDAPKTHPRTTLHS